MQGLWMITIEKCSDILEKRISSWLEIGDFGRMFVN